MKPFRYVCLFLIVALSSCNENFENVDPKKLNATLTRTCIKTPKDLVVAFDTASAHHEGLTVTSENADDDKIKITAIYDIRDDDEVCGEKYIFTAEHRDGLWKVLDIKYNWRYCSGYGHTDWGTK